MEVRKMIDFKKLFVNQYCKDGTLKARNSIMISWSRKQTRDIIDSFKCD